jgi:inorganic pyrophosphatase
MQGMWTAAQKAKAAPSSAPSDLPDLRKRRCGSHNERAGNHQARVGSTIDMMSQARPPKHQVQDLRPYNEPGKCWHVVIETPKGSHNKYQFDPSLRLFSLSGVLPEGMSFPYDFGFLPLTLGEDGDTVDVLLLMDHPAFCGCVVPSRLIGVIEAEQTERDGKTQRNDRLIAIPIKARTFSECNNIKDLDEQRLAEIEQFFVSYNHVRGKKFKVLKVRGAPRAEELAHNAMAAYDKTQRRQKTSARRAKRK